jgi:hypothetical protein
VATLTSNQLINIELYKLLLQTTDALANIYIYKTPFMLLRFTGNERILSKCCEFYLNLINVKKDGHSIETEIQVNMLSETEKYLITSIHKGDYRVFEMLFQTYYTALCAVAFSMVHFEEHTMWRQIGWL